MSEYPTQNPRDDQAQRRGGSIAPIAGVTSADEPTRAPRDVCSPHHDASCLDLPLSEEERRLLEEFDASMEGMRGASAGCSDADAKGDATPGETLATDVRAWQLIRGAMRDQYLQTSVAPRDAASYDAPAVFSHVMRLLHQAPAAAASLEHASAVEDADVLRRDEPVIGGRAVSSRPRASLEQRPRAGFSRRQMMGGRKGGNVSGRAFQPRHLRVLLAVGALVAAGLTLVLVTSNENPLVAGTAPDAQAGDLSGDGAMARRNGPPIEVGEGGDPSPDWLSTKRRMYAASPSLHNANASPLQGEAAQVNEPGVDDGLAGAGWGAELAADVRPGDDTSVIEADFAGSTGTVFALRGRTGHAMAVVWINE